MSVKCPRCQGEFEELIRIEAGLRLRITQVLDDENIPDEACGKCFNELRVNVSQGAKLRAEVNVKEHNKRVLWKNRVSLVKAGRERMSVKAFAEASVLYEKYIKTLEVVHGEAGGPINAQSFKAKGQEKELTLYASVLWDLIRIYDTRENYAKRMENTANRLLEVLPHTAAGKDIVNRAERFAKVANNPKEIRDFLKKARKLTNSSCFIATAVFYFDDADEVVILRNFRDQVLSQYLFGRIFIKVYYAFSPSLANLLDRFPYYKAPIRSILKSFALRLAKNLNLKSTR